MYAAVNVRVTVENAKHQAAFNFKTAEAIMMQREGEMTMNGIPGLLGWHKGRCK